MRPLPVCGDREHLLPSSGIVITPSNIDPWRSTRGEDQLFTWSQLSALNRLGLDPEKVDFVIVRSKASRRDMYWPSYDPAPTYLLPCPILGRRGTDQLEVISPAGMRKWVYSDGSITRRGWAPPKRYRNGR